MDKTIRQKIQEEMETDPMPDLVLGVLKEENGKKLTKRIIPKLEAAGVDRPRIEKRYGWTSIGWGDYQAGHSIMVSRSDKNVTIDSDWVWEENARYFDARNKRNAKREALLKTDLPERIYQKVRAYLFAQNELRNELDKVSEEYSGILPTYSLELPEL